MILDDLRPAGQAPLTLFDHPKHRRAPALMAAVDAINAKYGRHAIRPASMGFAHAWALRAERKSPCYTTRLAEAPKVSAR